MFSCTGFESKPALLCSTTKDSLAYEWRPTADTCSSSSSHHTPHFSTHTLNIPTVWLQQTAGIVPEQLYNTNTRKI